MLHNVTQCYTMLRNTMLRIVTQCYAMLRNTMLRNVTQCYATQCYAMLRNVTQHDVTQPALADTLLLGPATHHRQGLLTRRCGCTT